MPTPLLQRACSGAGRVLLARARQRLPHRLKSAIPLGLRVWLLELLKHKGLPQGGSSSDVRIQPGRVPVVGGTCAGRLPGSEDGALCAAGTAAMAAPAHSDLLAAASWSETCRAKKTRPAAARHEAAAMTGHVRPAAYQRRALSKPQVVLVTSSHVPRMLWYLQHAAQHSKISFAHAAYTASCTLCICSPVHVQAHPAICLCQKPRRSWPGASSSEA